MIGPSSSHTAGAARLGRIAREIIAKPFNYVSFGLHGSFAKTFKGHGTDKALLAGTLGLKEDDERLSDAFSIAKEQGVGFNFYETELHNVHENSVKMIFAVTDGGDYEVIGSSIGGSKIVIRKIDEFDIVFYAMMPTLFIWQEDKKGIVTEVARILADENLNIGTMKLSRSAKGGNAFCIIETDDQINAEIIDNIQALPNVQHVSAINTEPKEV